MALITCPECAKQISDRAASCPNCGFASLGQTLKCPDCAASIESLSKPCKNCGRPPSNKTETIPPNSEGHTIVKSPILKWGAYAVLMIIILCATQHFRTKGENCKAHSKLFFEGCDELKNALINTNASVSRGDSVLDVTRFNSAEKKFELALQKSIEFNMPDDIINNKIYINKVRAYKSACLGQPDMVAIYLGNYKSLIFVISDDKKETERLCYDGYETHIKSILSKVVDGKTRRLD